MVATDKIFVRGGSHDYDWSRLISVGGSFESLSCVAGGSKGWLGLYLESALLRWWGGGFQVAQESEYIDVGFGILQILVDS